MSTGGAAATQRGTARRFVAVPVPADVREHLAATLPQHDDPRLAGLRWSRPDGWHLTLAFLGMVADDQVDTVTDAVVGAVAAVAPQPEHLRLSRAGRFGHKVLWVGVEEQPEGSLTTLAAAVRTAVGKAGISVDRRPLHPHVTLARAGRCEVTATHVAACRTPEGPGWQPHGVELWRSGLGEGPARYEVEATIPFRAAPR